MLLTRVGWSTVRVSCLTPALALPLLASLTSLTECQQDPYYLHWPLATLRPPGYLAGPVAISYTVLVLIQGPPSQLAWGLDLEVPGGHRPLKG